MEDREIRLSRSMVSEGAPPGHSSTMITKYTGDSTAPEWKDAEPGRVLFPLIHCSKHLGWKRQVRDVVPYQGRYLQLPVYNKGWRRRKNGLRTEVQRDSTRGSHRAEGTGLLGRLPIRTWALVQSTCTHSSHPISIPANPGDREKVCSNALRVYLG